MSTRCADGVLIKSLDHERDHLTVSVTFNLATEPIVPVLDRDGRYREVSLTDVVTNPENWVTVVDGPHPVEPLTGAGMVRLLAAIWTAATLDDRDPADWMEDNQHRFEVYDTEAPFGQHPGIRPMFDEVAKPASMLPLFTASEGSVLLSHDHNEAGVGYPVATAVRLMLVRLAFGTAQRQPLKATVFGPAATYGKNTPALTRPWLWVESPHGLADSLRLSTAPATRAHTAAQGASRRTSQASEGAWTWPTGLIPGEPNAPTNQVQALTWPGRAMLLDRPRSDTGLVTRVSYGAGAVWEAATPEENPNTMWRPDPTQAPPSDSAPTDEAPRWVPLRATVASGWTRRLLQAWTQAPGVTLAGSLREMSVGERTGLMLRWQGLVADKGRVDAAMDHVFPVPTVPDETITEWLEAAFARYRTSGGRIRTAVSLAHSMGDTVTKRLADEVTSQVNGFVDQLSPHVAVGDLSVTAAAAILDTRIASALDQLAADRFVHRRTVGAALSLSEIR